jgi:hypothetical protein
LTPWLALGVIALFWILSQVSDKIPEDPIERLKRTFGADKIPHFVVLIAALLWGALVLLLSIGLITLLFDIVWNTVQPVGREAKGDFRFLLTKTAALTAVLGAMVALPFTALRLKHTAAQTQHAANVLFNEKLNDANNDLHARYQTSEKQENGYIDVWKDDIIRRNGAIDRLEALAVERPAMAPRIARMLCVYLREMTRDHPAEKMPEGLTVEEIWKWANGLKVQRSDMETAAQVLGRLHELTQVPVEDLAIDLTGVNLQAMQLSALNFEQATLERAAMDGVELNRAILNRAILNGAILNRAIFNEETNLRAVHATAAALRSVNLKDVPNLDGLVKSAFGDASVILPDDIKPLVKDKWPDHELDYLEYTKEWERFKKDPDAYVPPQDHEE